jgi:hypothetical protein
VDGLWAWPREGWCGIEAGDGVCGNEDNDPSSEALSSSLPSLRRNMESADDFERL